MTTPVGIAVTRGVAWQLAQAISPRVMVRVIPPGALRYSATHDLDAGIPDTPWAVHLADDQGHFYYLVFDLDAHDPDVAPRAAEDCTALSELLTRLRIRHVITASAGVVEGGRHIWVALSESVEAWHVEQIAHRAGLLFGTLDKAPLCNPRTGCVRSPGAPHRSGTTATLLQGRLAWLTRATTTPEQVLALSEALRARVDGLDAVRDADDQLVRKMPLDDHGHPYLHGTRRPLPHAIQDLLQTPWQPGTDASAVLWSVFLACALARWHHADVAALAATAPGLEHARTMRGASRARRVPRPTRAGDLDGTTALVARQWHKAVAHAATTRFHDADTQTWDDLAAPITTFVATLQQGADASPGRWRTGRGPSARRVLDALCLWALDALKTTLDGSLRYLADTCAISHETVRNALGVLADWGYLTKTADGIGTHAATYTLTPPGAIHSPPNLELPHNVPGGAPKTTSNWDTWRATLRCRLAGLRHDVWHRKALGIAAGNAWANPALNTPEIAQRLRAHGIGPLTTPAHLDTIAGRFNVLGVLAWRANRHRVERWQYQWWLAELQHLHDRDAPPRRGPDDRPWRRYPRGRGFLPHHREALRAVDELLQRRNTTPARIAGAA